MAWTSNSARQILALLICCFLTSCAPSATLPPAPEQTAAPLDSRWEKLRGIDHERSALRAMADIDLMASGGGRQHLRIALVLRLPSMMRMESIPVFGPPDFSLSLNREKLKIFLPGRKEFYQGRPSRENLSHFLPISLSPTDIVYVLLGFPPPVTGGKIGYRESRDGDRKRLDLFLKDQIIQTLWSDGNVERLTDMAITDREAELTHRVSYSNYLRLGESELPQEVTIVSKGGGTKIAVHFEDMDLDDSAGDEEAFDLPIPKGVTPISLDRDDRPRD